MVVRRRHLIAILATYLLLALLGVYADWRLLAYFDIDYLTYADLGDYLLAPLRVLHLVADLGFTLLFMLFAIGLTLLVAGCRYVLRAIGELWPGRPQATASDALPFVEPFKVPETFRSDLGALLRRPLRLAPVFGVAAALAITVNAALDTQDLRSFAKLIQHTQATDRYQKLRSSHDRYELVSVWALAAGAPLQHLVRLVPTGSFGFYYDVLDDRPVIVPGDTILSEVADAELAGPAVPATARVELPIGPPQALGQDIGEAGGPPPEGRSDRDDVVVAPLRSDPARAVGGGTGGTLPAQPSPAPQQVVLALDDPAAQDNPESPAVADVPPQPADLKTPGARIEALEASLQQSRGALEGLKSYVQRVEGSFAEIQKVIDQLDGRLNQVDGALGQLADQPAEPPADPLIDQGADQPATTEPVAYADCPDLTAGQPIEFGPNDATLSLKAIGWLYQSRRQLAAERSAEQQEWLVIEGHADRSGQSAVNHALPRQRAEAVRDFLQSELGIPAAVLKVVGAGSAGSGGRFVNLYDCRRRPPAHAPSAPTTAQLSAPITAAAAAPITAQAPAPATVGLRPAQGATVAAVNASGLVRPAAWEAGDEPGLSALLADLDPTPQARGLLVSVPGDRLFDTESYQIRTSAYGVLGRIGEALIRAPGRDAVIIGHSDAIGDAVYNRLLSEQRARAVRDFLVDKFRINADRLAVEGRGEDDPIATNDTRAGRAANRRIEVLLLD